MTPRVSLDIDLGELPDEPDELYSLATLVNIACGAHAGDPTSMARAVHLALSHGATIAAHPSYPDRANFGRTSMAASLSLDDLEASLSDQLSTLRSIATSAGADVYTLKLHGALYHDASRDPSIAARVLRAAGALGVAAPPPAGTRHPMHLAPPPVADTPSPPPPPRPGGSAVSPASEPMREMDAVLRVGGEGAGASSRLRWIGPPRGALRDLVVASGGVYLCEGFAERGMLADGSLIPRGQPGAVIHEPERAAAQAVALARSGEFQAICVHGDSPNAVAVARAVRRALEDEGLLALPDATGERAGAAGRA